MYINCDNGNSRSAVVVNQVETVIRQGFAHRGKDLRVYCKRLMLYPWVTVIAIDDSWISVSATWISTGVDNSDCRPEGSTTRSMFSSLARSPPAPRLPCLVLLFINEMKLADRWSQNSLLLSSSRTQNKDRYIIGILRFMGIADGLLMVRVWWLRWAIPGLPGGDFLPANRAAPLFGTTFHRIPLRHLLNDVSRY
jgi:hypothetical protein